MTRRVCKNPECEATGELVDTTGFCSDSCADPAVYAVTHLSRNALIEAAREGAMLIDNAETTKKKVE